MQLGSKTKRLIEKITKDPFNKDRDRDDLLDEVHRYLEYLSKPKTFLNNSVTIEDVVCQCYTEIASTAKDVSPKNPKNL
jgi:hypothetical protein